MTETITRLCSCSVEFTPHGDRFDDARREKLRKKRCPECGRKQNEEDNRSGKNSQPSTASGKVKKGKEVSMLPLNATVLLNLQADGWHGRLNADGVEVETVSAGAMGILSKLARKWLSARGKKLQGQVKS
jgi:hypothetical protein